MMREPERVDLRVEALLQHGRVIQPVSDVVRARALVRARLHMAAADTMAPVLAAPTRGRTPRFVMAASLALILGAAGAAAALHGRIPHPPEAAIPVLGPPLVRAPQPGLKPTVSTEPPGGAAPSRREKAARPARSVIARESYTAELELLHRAQVAHARRNFSSALSLVAEHSRRFPKGRLSEEREALRVQSLVGAGRNDDARRAVALFARRFPRSVFLPHLQETAAGVE